MSIKVFGILELKNELTLKEKIELSFLVVEMAIKNKFGINLGGNIFSGFRKKYEKSSKKIFIFEITDDPLDINAECLFTGNYIIEANDELGENLKSRMLRVQNFLDMLLKTTKINRIILDINALEINEYTPELSELNAKEFCNKILELYKQNENQTPTIRIIVN